MKRFITPYLFIISTLSMVTLQAQNCDFAQAGVRYNYSNVDASGKCIVNLDLYFDLQTNRASKYVAMHIWPTSSYPNLSYNTPPLATDLAGASTIVIHHFQDHANSHIDTVYNPDPAVQPQYQDMHLTIGPGDVTGYDRFTITNINLGVAGSCDMPQSFVVDIWSTESESMNSVHCIDRQTTFYTNNPKVITLFNCSIPRTFDVQIVSIDPQPLTLNYKVYVDDGDNIFNKTLDTLVISSQEGIVISKDINYNSGTVAYLPYASMPPYVNMNLWVEVSSSSLPNSVVAMVENSCAALPVKLKSFDAIKQGPTIVLNWVTAGEDFNKGFGIERRVGDKPWEQIGFVNSSAIRGHSTSEITYLYIDYINLKGFIQYRLKQTNLNGDYEYSEIRIVKSDVPGVITIFPNPSTGNVNIGFADVRLQYDVRVYDEGGRLINKWENCKATLTIGNLKPAIYIFKIDEKQNKRVTTHKVIILNKTGG